MQPQFGDIYTNDINFWIVTFAGTTCCSRCGKGEEYRVELKPVIFSDGKPRHMEASVSIVGIESIKPFARKIGHLVLNT